jgi:hypothetical protein
MLDGGVILTQDDAPAGEVRNDAVLRTGVVAPFERRAEKDEPTGVIPDLNGNGVPVVERMEGGGTTTGLDEEAKVGEEHGLIVLLTDDVVNPRR